MNKLLIVFLMLTLVFVGCYSDDKVLSGQQEINNRLDSLSAELDQHDLSRVELIRTAFDSLSAYNYYGVNVDIDTTGADHDHVDIRYVDYYSFFSNPSELWDGDYYFKRVITDGYEEFTADHSIHKDIGNNVVYESYGNYRIVNERNIDMLRIGGTNYSLRFQSWYSLSKSLSSITDYILSGEEIYLGDGNSGARYNITHSRNSALLENGGFDY